MFTLPGQAVANKFGVMHLLVEHSAALCLLPPVQTHRGRKSSIIVKTSPVSCELIDRTDICWLDVTDSSMDIQTKIREGDYLRYPVAEGDLDNIIGLVFVKDWIVHTLDSEGSSETEVFDQIIGGFVLSYLVRAPKAGDYFTWQNLIIEVVDMNWRRVDKVLLGVTGDS